MLVIGLTGGIGTGKSTVAGMLRDLGAILVDADKVGHEVLRPDGPAWQPVVDAFGRQVLGPGGAMLAQNHDERGLDPLAVVTAPADGMYVVRLFAFPAVPDSTIGLAGGEAYIYRLTLTAEGSGIQDAAGNALASSAAATVAFDNVAPMAAITPNGIAVNTNPITFTVTFSEAVTGVDLADLTATGSTTWCQVNPSIVPFSFSTV